MEIGRPPSQETIISTSTDNRTVRRVTTSAAIGNFIEWFDYATYGYLATVIAAVFFCSR